MARSYSINVDLRLEVQDDLLAFRPEGWQLRISNLVLIAEYTTDEGPYIDDYFLVFWTRENGELLKAECSFYAEGRDLALAEAGRVLGVQLDLGLASSTEWNSRVIWPEELRGKPYYEFTNVPRVGFWQEILSGFLGDALEYKMTTEVRGFLMQSPAS